MLLGYLFIYICRLPEEYPVLELIKLEKTWAIAMLICFALTHKGKFMPFSGGKMLLGFLGLVLASGLWAYDFAAWQDISYKFFKICLVSFLMVNTVKTREEFACFMTAVVMIFFVYELKSLIEYTNGRYVYRMGLVRMVGIGQTYNNPNSFASTVCLTIPYAYALFRDSAIPFRRIVKPLLLGLFVLSAVCVVLTGSRTGFASLAFLAVIYILANKHSFRNFVLLGVAFVVIWTFTPGPQKERILSTIYSKDEIELDYMSEKTVESATVSAESRILGLVNGFELMCRRPIGYGVGGFATARALVGGPYGLRSHNLYGQVMGELGILGIILFGALVVGCIKRNIAVIKYEKSGLFEYAKANMICLVLLLFQGFAGHMLYRYTWYWIIAYTAIMLNLVRRDLALSESRA
ncbi:O-antigen ligase family protein [Pseudodesulfovibrio cashew]|nr:O-antigen ligase family protein [Pseudodesulfovibrio cashew]